MMDIARLRGGDKLSGGKVRGTLVPADLFLAADRMQKRMHVPHKNPKAAAVGSLCPVAARSTKVPNILPRPSDKKRLAGFSGSSSVDSPLANRSDRSKSSILEFTIRSAEKLIDPTLTSTSTSTSASASTSTFTTKPKPFVHPQYTGCRYDVAKPPYSYASLIAQALLASPDHRLTLNQIYAWIMERYPYYQSENSGWQNSIRHNLSLNSCFVRVAKDDKTFGKGSNWTLNEEELSLLKDGTFKRRKLGPSSGSIGKPRRKKTSEKAGPSSMSFEPIAPSITDWEPLDGRTSGPSSDCLMFEWDGVLLAAHPKLVNDAQVNGAYGGLKIEDLYRASSPGHDLGSAQKTNRAMSVDLLCPELAETCAAFNTWDMQRSVGDVRTDLTDPLEFLGRL